MRNGICSDYKKHINNILDMEINRYGKLNYVYGVMNKNNTNNMMIISDFPDIMVDNYLDNRWQSIDPVIINALKRITPFPWDENIKADNKWTARKIFKQLKNINIHCGHAFVLHDQIDNVAVLSLYINKLMEGETKNNIARHKDELQGLLLYIHDIFLTSKQTAEKPDITPLSTRESEILHWCRTGKTYPELADILEISVSTIKFHMGKIVKKLGVKNAKQAIIQSGVSHNSHDTKY